MFNSLIKRFAAAAIAGTAVAGTLGLTATASSAAAYEKACFVWSTGARYTSELRLVAVDRTRRGLGGVQHEPMQ